MRTITERARRRRLFFEELRTVRGMVEGNARVINEIYDSLMKLRKAVAILHDELIRDELEDLPEIPELEDLPDPELEEVARLHAEWDGKSPHPYGCDGGEGPDELSPAAKMELAGMPAGRSDAGEDLDQDAHPELEQRPDAGAGGSADIQQETTADNQTLSAVEPGDEDG